jgi:hypothetical protein
MFRLGVGCTFVRVQCIQRITKATEELREQEKSDSKTQRKNKQTIYVHSNMRYFNKVSSNRRENH